MFTKKSLEILCFVIIFVIVVAISNSSTSAVSLADESDVRGLGPVVIRKEERRSVVSTEYGEISAVHISDNINGSYLLHFFTLEQNALFLPVVLHADMVFYVHTGSGKLSWVEEEDSDLKQSDLRRGDVFRLGRGAVFYVHSYSESTQTNEQRLRIHAIFTNSNNDLREPATGAYSSIQDTVRGFGRRILQSTFQVSEEVIDELLAGRNPPLIVHAGTELEKEIFDQSKQGQTYYNILNSLNKKKKKEKEKEKKKEKEEKGNAKLFNLFEEERDIENCNGWSTMVTRNKLSALKGSDIGLFMVNLTIGSMMAPHWNPTSSEVSIALQGRGMVRVLCSDTSNYDQTTCRDMRYEVGQGDVFVVPQFNPVTQMSFNNDTFVFMGFSISKKRNYPHEFVGGEYSMLRALDKRILAMSFNVTGETLERLLAPKDELGIVGCISCAEEELMIMEDEMGAGGGEARPEKE